MDAVKRVAMGLLVALAFFSAVEGVLWIAGVVPLHVRSDPYVGFAGYSPLFVEQAAPDGRRLLVTAPGKLRWFNRQQFPVEKATGVGRIFCLGGSTTYGRPYDDRTSFCGWLREFLPAVDPNRKWEVINAGGISYASYRIVRLMEDLVQYEPDVFVVYTGHNEFLEERTYASVRRVPEAVRSLTSLASRLRLYSVMSDVMTNRVGEGDMLPAEVDAVLDRSVGPEAYHRDDKLRDAVLEHFRTSLLRMADMSATVGANMIFVTPASNIGDFSPFKSEPDILLGSGEIEELGRLRMTAEQALTADEPNLADQSTAQALAIDARNPDLLFLRGQALRALQQPEAARRAFVMARDEDIAPLRAPTNTIRTVEDVARQEQTGLVDFVRMIDELSPDRIPGNEFFLDHVHPTIEGNRRLGLAIVDELIRSGFVRAGSEWTEATVDRITERVSADIDEEAHALARRSLANVLIWAGKHDEAARLVDQSVEAMPANGEVQFQKATLLLRERRFAEALPHLESAVALSPGNAAIRKEYGITLSELGRKREALESLRVAAEMDPALNGVHYELGVVLADLGDVEAAEQAYRAELNRHPGHSDANNNLGVILAMQGQVEAALGFFERAVRENPENRNAADNLERARALLRD